MLSKFRKFEFEYRIFFSLGFVVIICLLSFFVYPHIPELSISLGKKIGLPEVLSLRIGFMTASAVMLGASILRMWAGSVLTPPRVMSFRIQKEVLVTEGPYHLSRNPIYLADLACFFSFVFVLPPIGLLLPVLLYIHYLQLIAYEEEQLEVEFGSDFVKYAEETPRFLPNWSSSRKFLDNISNIRISRDGIRHNAQYTLLIPGFLVSAFTGKLIHAILIGLPGIIDWAVVHTIIGLNPERKRKKSDNDLFQDRVFKDIIYAQCWEDPQMDIAAFQTNEGAVIFSITSGGCNTLAFLQDNPARIYALDISPYQNYLLELKISAFKNLSYHELLQFLGVRKGGDRYVLYQSLKKDLSPACQDYWDENRNKIKQGVLHSGRYERYMHLLRKGLLMLVGRSLPEKLLQCKHREERVELYEHQWNTWRWRFFTRLFLSRRLMTLLFTDKFFEHLEYSFSFGDHFRDRIKKAVTEIPLSENHFLSYILFGGFREGGVLPVYLKPEYFEKIRNRLDHIEIICTDPLAFFQTLPDSSIDCFNCSNIFEWMPRSDFIELLKEIIRVGKKGSILTYRNLLVERSRPDVLADYLQPQTELAVELHEQDHSFIYRAYHVEKNIKNELPIEYS